MIPDDPGYPAALRLLDDPARYRLRGWRLWAPHVVLVGLVAVWVVCGWCRHG